MGGYRPDPDWHDRVLERARKLQGDLCDRGAQRARTAVPVDTGRLLASIYSDRQRGRFGASAPYAAYVELGHRSVAWGRETGTWVAPQAFLHPALLSLVGGA